MPIRINKQKQSRTKTRQKRIDLAQIYDRFSSDYL